MTDQARRKFLIGSSLGLIALCFGALGLSETKKTTTKKGIKKSTKKPLAKKAITAPAKPLAKTAISKPLSNVPNPRLGINLGEVNYYVTEFPFVDLMKMSSGFNLDNSSDTTFKDANGYFKSIPASASFATCLVCEIPSESKKNQYIKNGKYVFLYDGETAVMFDASGKQKAKNCVEIKGAKVLSSSANRIVLDCDFAEGMRINIHGINAARPIKNIRIVPIEQESTYLTNPWKQEFLDIWAGTSCVRFMDMMKTNGSKQSAWVNRPQLGYVTYGTNEFIADGKGMPLEMMVDLANRLDADPWFCIPHLADDDYVKQFAVFLKDNLNPNLKAYIEYSNEVWNGGFEQTNYATQQALKLRLARADTGKDQGGASEYKAYRSIQIFAIFDAVYGASRVDRVVRVLASQAAWTAMSEAVCSFQDAYKHADVLAIAPYPQFNVSPTGDLQESMVKRWSSRQVFDFLLNKSLPETIGWIKESKKVADQYKLKLVAYEGGQHCVGVAGSENNDDVTKLLHEVNADARMGELYTKLLDAWSQAGGDLFVHYSSVSRWSKWGSWSILQSLYEPKEKSPKYLAVTKWANARGQKMKL